MTKTYLLDLTPEEIEKLLVSWGHSAFRGRQVVKWLYEKRVDSFDSCTDMPKGLREELSKKAAARTLTLDTRELSCLDGTIRYQFLTHDGFRIPTVFLPSRDRNSVCISTQIGCPIGCTFCASGRVKFRRNLSAGEIVEQILQAEHETGRRITGVLFMGMGEPLMNYDNTVAALKAITGFRQLGIGRRHITVSTSGVVPNIRKLADETMGVRLALSLHAPDDATRHRFIPDKLPYSVIDILQAGLYYSRKTNSRLTLEYNLVGEVNDSVKAAETFAKLINTAARLKDEVQVNLIPCNPTDRSKFDPPVEEHINRFKNILLKHDILVNIREAKGADIGAACGQLGV